MDDNFKKLIDICKIFFPIEQVRYIFEMGAKDCSDTLRFRKNFPLAEIYCFECNSETLPLCRKAVQNMEKIHLTEKAVSDIDGKITFYPIDTKKTITTHKDGNPGASSIFKATGKYPNEHYVQKETVVDSIRLDNFMNEKSIPGIDILWLDTQGAELKILNGLGKKLRTVRLIHTEVEFMEIYANQPLFGDIKKFLLKNGFRFFDFTYKGACFGDAVFVNKDLAPSFWGLKKKWIKRKMANFFKK